MYDPYPIARTTNNPVHSVRRVAAYAQYPLPTDERSSRNGGGRSRASFALPEKAKRTVRTAADSAAAWLTQNRGLRASLSVLTSPHTTAFEERAVAFDDDNAAVTGAAARGAERAAYTISVLGLARGQVNVSYELAAAAPSVVGAGKHSFMLTSGKLRETLSASVAPGDSNAAMLSRLAGAINGSEAGISAQIDSNPAAGTQRLTIMSDSTGAAQSFALSDLSGFIIAGTGAATIAVAASDAVYRIDGEQPLRSPNNEIVLQGGKVALRLHAVAKAAAVTIVVDSHAIARQLGAVVDQTNELNETFENASDYLDESLRENIDAVLGRPAANELGISLSSEGRWTLDSAKLMAGVRERPDSMRRLATGPDGIAAALSETLVLFERMPAEAMLSAAADGFQSYIAYQSSLQPYLQLQLNGAFVNSSH